MTAPETSEEPRRRGRLHQRLHANPALSLTTKIVVTTLGVLVMGAGLVMMVTPGPGIVGIVLGLAILATEWAWAERWLGKARQKAHEARLKAEAMDPKVRRRRMLLTGLVVVLVVGAVAVYVAVYDWPSLAIDGWNWVQSLAGWMPELPGM
ncbi:MAG TPA: PGPGW domain-containing protein [Nocardioidaceae bacterium]|nr:PGPGW domain-containing protein [Nocardioidaceae bacterium]